MAGIQALPMLKANNAGGWITEDSPYQGQGIGSSGGSSGMSAIGGMGAGLNVQPINTQGRSALNSDVGMASINDAGGQGAAMGAQQGGGWGAIAGGLIGLGKGFSDYAVNKWTAMDQLRQEQADEEKNRVTVNQGKIFNRLKLFDTTIDSQKGVNDYNNSLGNSAFTRNFTLGFISAMGGKK